MENKKWRMVIIDFFDEYAEESCLVQATRNHPSIVMWSWEVRSMGRSWCKKSLM
jgi:hypothetical protein